MCSRVCLAWRAMCRFALLLGGGLERRQVGVERDLRVDHDQLAAGQAHEHVRAQLTLAGLDRATARRSRSGRPSPPSRPRCAAGSRPRSPASRAASARRRGCRSPCAACPTPCVSVRTISASCTCASRRSRSRRASSLSTLPSFSCTGSTSRLISAVRVAISPAARCSSALRWSASRCASDSPVCASTSAEIAFSSSRSRSRLGLIAAAAPAAPRIRPIRIPSSSSSTAIIAFRDGVDGVDKRGQQK